MRRTKIIATLGPATETPELISGLVAAGVNVFRLNMSHAKPEWCRLVVGRVREAAAQAAQQCALLMDLKGPTIRTGDLPNSVVLKAGDLVEFLLANTTPRHAIATTVNYPNLWKDLAKGDTVLVDNGVIQMKALELSPESVVCEVLTDGRLGSRRHINLPGIKTNLPPLTERDYSDIALAAELGCEFVAMSFVRDAEHLHLLREALKKQASRAAIVAKIEDFLAVANLDEIIHATDVLMVARGDLGIEMPLEELPIIQRKAVAKCIRLGKRVIVATHMLESMVENPVPTRAEVTDIANAVLEQVDAIMLSGETSTGSYPLRCVEIMGRISRRMEQEIDTSAAENAPLADDKMRVVKSAVTLADSFKEASILVFTQRGKMARHTSHLRPIKAPIFAFCPDEFLCRQLTLNRAVTAFPLTFSDTNVDQAIADALAILRHHRLLTPKEKLVIISDVLLEGGQTDSILVREA